MNNDDDSYRLYRPCIAIALFNRAGKVFVGERIDTPGAWQMPQGGIDEGEDIEQAMLRELNEEIGVDTVEILAKAPHSLRYDLPGRLSGQLWKGRYHGQDQTWIAARYTGEDRHIRIDLHYKPEFRNWKWVNLEDTIDMIVPFKRDIYKQIIEWFKPYAVPSDH